MNNENLKANKLIVYDMINKQNIFLQNFIYLIDFPTLCRV